MAVTRAQSSFKGNTDGMKGNVFQCHGETTDKQQFIKTVGVLEEHINKTFTNPETIAPMCKTFVIPTIKRPKNLTKTEYEDDMVKREIWKNEIKTYMKKLETLEGNKRAAYAIVWGQCSPMMQAKIESVDSYT